MNSRSRWSARPSAGSRTLPSSARRAGDDSLRLNPDVSVESSRGACACHSRGVPRLHALEFVPDPAGREAVLRDWHALRGAGLPSQLDHRGPTNTPHLTVVTAVDVGPAVPLAVALLLPLLPVRVRVAGLLVLGGRQVTLARAVDAPDALAAAVAAVRTGTPGRQHDGWLPHLTLARRLPRSEVQRALDVLGHEDVEVTLCSLRRWDPDAGTVSPVA